MDKLKALELLVKAKELGITEQDIEGVLTTRKTHVPELAAEEIVAPPTIFDQMSDEEIMYWATPYYDELQAKKEAMANQRKEDEGLKS
jgi:hypothetical protein